MIALNLLPPVERQRLRLRQRERRVVRSVVLVILSLLFVTGLAHLGAVWMEERTKDLQTAQIPGGSPTPLVALRSEIAERAGFVQTLLNEQAYTPRVLPALLEVTPPAVQLTQLKFDATTGLIELTGKGQSRSDVLAFRAAIEQLPTVTRVVAPLSNLAQRTAIDFTFTINLVKP